jgi:trk system potassium uptake protein
MTLRHFFRLIALSLQTQLSVLLGLLFCLASSYYFLAIGDARYPTEDPSVLWAGVLASLACVIIGRFWTRSIHEPMKLNLKDGAIVVLGTWFFAVAISTMVFVLAGFPIPSSVESFSLLRRITDGIFESVSGYTTAGGSILPSVEAFSRSILLWRSTTHLLGGMGMAYMAVTLFRHFAGKRETILTGEAEGPNEVRFDDERDARKAGFDFLKIYGLLNFLMIVLLILAGIYGRSTPYLHWYDNVFDAVNHTFSTMGTGGFGVYDESVGLPISTNTGVIIGGLENKAAEWIIAIFMLIAGGNLALWYILFFQVSHWKKIIHNTEFKVYVGFVSLITFGIWLILLQHTYYISALDDFRYALFNVATIISTTGLGNTNFHLWPAGAIGLLFLVYFVGGMVGSTAGGLKILRFVVLYRCVKIQLQNLLFGRNITRFTVDGVTYDLQSASLIVFNVILYYIIFMLGAIAILIASPIGVLPDGSTKSIDLMTGLTASIANLGNIGPTAAMGIGGIDAGPAGNYFAFSISAKLIMSILMMIGRIGVFTYIILFISKIGLRQHELSPSIIHFDADEPHLKK